LPIPNREVKPYCADGTAPSGWESRTLPDQHNSLVVVRLQGFFVLTPKNHLFWALHTFLNSIIF
ncbi:MAG: hypothetical protein KBF75_06045, partial [Saprospiraceae bacterium]|nr:hypothetical protein [Saprospiraceae bacterium]